MSSARAWVSAAIVAVMDVAPVSSPPPAANMFAGVSSRSYTISVPRVASPSVKVKAVSKLPTSATVIASVTFTVPAKSTTSVIRSSVAKLA